MPGKNMKSARPAVAPKPMFSRCTGARQSGGETAVGFPSDGMAAARQRCTLRRKQANVGGSGSNAYSGVGSGASPEAPPPSCIPSNSASRRVKSPTLAPTSKTAPPRQRAPCGGTTPCCKQRAHTQKEKRLSRMCEDKCIKCWHGQNGHAQQRRLCSPGSRRPHRCHRHSATSRGK